MSESLGFVGTARFYDVVLLLIVAELAAMAAYRAMSGRGVALAELATFLGSGLALFLALRGLARGSAPVLVASALLAALVLHLLHLRQRWRS